MKTKPESIEAPSNSVGREMNPVRENRKEGIGDMRGMLWTCDLYLGVDRCLSGHPELGLKQATWRSRQITPQ